MGAIREYIESIDQYIVKNLENLFDGINSIILYGASEKGKRFVKDYRDTGVVIKYFCDDSEEKWGTFVEGIEVIPPKELINLTDLPIFITSKWSDDISLKLKQIGIKHIYHRFAIDYILHLDELEQAYSLMFDTISKNTFLGLIKYIFSQDPSIFEKITTTEEQYFLKDIFEFNSNECIVDGGAYIGDTTLHYYEISGGSFDKIYCFEPDGENFKKLFENTKHLTNIELFNAGLYKQEGKVPFLDSHNSAACIDSSSSEFIHVTSIDEALQGNRITMIKLDIEGAEVDTLYGARNVINTQKPKLAICNYHLPSDLWEIPLLINEILPDYKLYMRHHNKKCWYETVVYANIE